MHLCRCEFCHTEYRPRPQVKNPRACNNHLCQKKRQLANEREWRERHKDLADKEYHRVRREQRRRKLQAISDSILKCLEVGSQFLNRSVDRAALSDIFTAFLFELGIRRANKFWQLDMIPDVAMLGR